MDLIGYMNTINMKHGATDRVYSTDTPESPGAGKIVLEFDLHLLQARCKSLGI